MTLVGVLVLTPDTLLVRIVALDPWTMAFWRSGAIALTIFIVVAVSRRSVNPRIFFGIKGYAWGNVVMINQKGDELRTEKLYWNKKEEFYSLNNNLSEK